MVWSQFWIVRVERFSSAAMARIEPPAWWASCTAARISRSASVTRWAAVRSRRRCAAGIVAAFRPGFVGTVKIVARIATRPVVESATI